MRSLVAGRRVLLFTLSATVSLAALWPARSDATVLPTGHRHSRDHFGNGFHNINQITLGSPTSIRGVQNASNSNAGSKDGAQNAFCKRRWHCRITQIWHYP